MSRILAHRITAPGGPSPARRTQSFAAPCTTGGTKHPGYVFRKIPIFPGMKTVLPAAVTVRGSNKEPHCPVAADKSISMETFEKAPNGVILKAKAVVPSLPFSGPQAPTNPPPPDGYRWLQTVVTNDPFPGFGKKSVDGAARGGNEPFYYEYGPKDKHPGDFIDTPRRQLPPHGKKIEWRATLSLVGVNQAAADPRAFGENSALKAYDMLSYGFDLERKPGTLDVARLTPMEPRSGWGALEEQRKIVLGSFPNWSFSMLRGKF